MSDQDLKTAIIGKLNEFLDECTLCEKSGIVFSGESWAYRRMLNFVNNL